VILVDSSGWIEFLVDGPLADDYADALAEPSEVLVPTVVLYEVYKWARRERGEEVGMAVAAQMTRCQVVALDQTIALTAADLALAHKLAMADALVYATARVHDAALVTSDNDFAGLAGARYLPRL
jgi:predicted nucleic acid-binding protein